ncbi:MAG: tRNA uridine-5-carboxymethylaminomethyl(34) synthesis GTPase MnmE [Erythrobacter sp.]|uniref:tRNA uridine-5-carboxymethylaminomethyl(34) synthesis GTPase MnmE n=1 Tax=Erythrobacter sp. TaxID=1042 RepID=UPI00329979CF
MSGDLPTIFAISSGAPPAAIGVIRVSGSKAGIALRTLIGRDVEPRRASLAKLRDNAGETLDEALVLWFPGPETATGEDLAELHCHGGRAVLTAVCEALGSMDGLRPAQEGEFTRRAFANGRIDLAQAEGLADLLEAETELQRAAAIRSVSGAISNKVEGWREQVLHLSAQIEAALDFSDEDDVSDLPSSFAQNIDKLTSSLEEWLMRPRSERLKEGLRIVLAGPPNSGKSTLFNALVESEAAITSSIAGTTRDVIERSVAISGVPFVFIDTAGLRSEGIDEIETIGIRRANDEFDRADFVLWLGAEGEGPDGAWEVAARSDCSDFVAKPSANHRVSAKTGEGLADLKDALVVFGRGKLPKPGEATLNARQRKRLIEAHDAVISAKAQGDFLLIGEDLRSVRLAFDRLIGRTSTEDMLDALFGRFCIGK